MDGLYSLGSGVIAAALLATLLLALEGGSRLGLRRHGRLSATYVSHVNALQASLLGILALLLGFTFSLALQRFDARSAAVVDEANAIGTSTLRARLLPSPLRGRAEDLLRDYVELRIAAGAVPLSAAARRDELIAAAAACQAELWEVAAEALRETATPLSASLFAQSVNELIDAFGSRDAALHRHVPEEVLLLLYLTFIMTGAIVGYAAGAGGHRPSLATYGMVVLIVVLVFIILDLDRPRRGFIQVSQRSLLELRQLAQPGAP